MVKSTEELNKMKASGRIAALTLDAVVKAVKPGVLTRELDLLAEEFIKAQGATPAFKGYRGFPASICVSVNEEVVHGIPGKRKIKSGDLVSIDLGVIKDGYCSDLATTVIVGDASPTIRLLVEVTREALCRAIKLCKPGKKIGDISAAIQNFVEQEHNFSVVRALAGHGIGRDMHEDPEVPNFGIAGFGPELKPGITLAIEPMVNLGTFEVLTKADNWTVVTADKKISAHFEHTVAITEDEPLVLTEIEK